MNLRCQKVELLENLRRLGVVNKQVVNAIALSEIARVARFLNIIIGAVLVVGIWLLAGSSLEVRWVVTFCSIAIITLSLPNGKFRKHFGSDDKLASWSPPEG